MGLFCEAKLFSLAIMTWSLVGNRPECYEAGPAQAELFEAHSVSYFRSVADPGGGFAALEQTESPGRFVGKRLSLAGAIRAEDVTGWAGLWMRVDGTESNRAVAYKNMAESPIKGSRDWARYALAVDIPADATNIAYGIVLHGEGSIWLADFTLGVAGDDFTEPAEAPAAARPRGSSSRADVAPPAADDRMTPTGGPAPQRSVSVARMLASRKPIRARVRLASGARFAFRLLTVEQPVTCAGFLESAISQSFLGTSPRLDAGAVFFGSLGDAAVVSPHAAEVKRLPVLPGSVIAVQREGRQIDGLFGVWTSADPPSSAKTTSVSDLVTFGVIEDGLDATTRLRPDDRIVEVQVVTPETTSRSVAGFDVWPAEGCPTFAQIGGMQPVKDQLAATVGLVLTDPARAAQLKVSFNGVLLYGPLGTGKSLFARALAGEYGCNLVLALAGQLQGAPNEIGRRLDEAFEVARSCAPSVLFFDEFDWLVTQADRRPLLDGLLDRLQRDLEGVPGDARVIVVAATQGLDDIDPSAIRPGVFDLKIRVGLPDGSARSAILEAQLGERPIDPDVDTSALAAATGGSRLRRSPGWSTRRL